MMEMLKGVGRWALGVGRRTVAAPAAAAGVTGDFFTYVGLLLRSPTFLLGCALIAAFWGVASVVEFDTYFMVLNFTIILVEVLVLFGYLPAFLACLLRWPPNERDQLIIGIWIAWSFDLVNRIWSLSWRFSGQPQWMLTSDFLTFMLFGRTIAAMLHVTAPTAVEGIVSKTSWLKLGLAFGLGVVATMAVIYLSIGGEINFRMFGALPLSLG